MLVVGDDDVEHGTVGVNQRGSDEPERDVPLDDFVARLAAEVAEHRVSSREPRAAVGGLARDVRRRAPTTGAPTTTSACSAALVAATDDEALVLERTDRRRSR